MGAGASNPDGNLSKIARERSKLDSKLFSAKNVEFIYPMKASLYSGVYAVGFVFRGQVMGSKGSFVAWV